MSDPLILPPLRQWLAGPLPPGVKEALDRFRQTPGVVRMAVMPDVHLANVGCIGNVVATSDHLIPHAVGGDIGCGMTAIAFQAEASILSSPRVAKQLLEALKTRVPVMRQPRDRVRDLGPLQAGSLSHYALARLCGRDGLWQLGTLGRGNHFLEFQEDDGGGLWLMVHSGSRAMGRAIAEHHLAETMTAPTGVRYLVAGSPQGQAYLNDVQWALTYADLNRRCLVDSVVELLWELFGFGAIPDSITTCDHNHVRQEAHFGESLWVHRKGAIDASEGRAGIIPGSMGSYSYHVEGRGEPESLHSSSHGAGRAMDRTRARRTINERELFRQLKGIWFDPRIADKLRDEAPTAYKDIQEVMRAQKDLTRIVRRLRPVLCHKGT